MKLGTQTGSVVNSMYGRMTNGAPEPEVGMGATIMYWTDRHAATVVAWDAQKQIVTVQEDNAVRTDKNGLSESQTYEFTPNPNTPEMKFKRDKTGAWRQMYTNENGKLRMYTKGNGSGLILGFRNHYRDPHF